MKFWNVLAWGTTLGFVMAVIGAYATGNWPCVACSASSMMFAWLYADARNSLAELKPDA